MNNSEQPNNKATMKNDHSLLNDTDFTALMEAELLSKPEHDNDVSKQRIWNSLQAQIHSNKKSTKISNSKNIYSIAASLLVIAIILPMFFLDINISDVTDNVERNKGLEATINTSLTIYTLDKLGKLTLSNGQHKVGTTLLFKVHSSQNGVASIISSKNGRLNYNGVIYTITQGKLGQLLSKQEQVYGYMIEPTDKILQFCIIAMASAENLQTKLDALSTTWTHLNASACSTINVTDSLDSQI